MRRSSAPTHESRPRGTLSRGWESKSLRTIPDRPAGRAETEASGTVSKLRIAATIAALTAAAGMAVAQDYANIVVANSVVARIRTGGDFGSLHAREAKISQRVVDALSYELDDIFSREHDGPNMKTYQSGGRWTLAVGDTMLIQAYSEDAVGTTTRALIGQWKENFRRQLPRAVAPSKVPQWWRDAHPDAVDGALLFQSHGLPEHDVPLVREIVAIFDAVRAMSDRRFAEVEENAQRALIERVRTYRNPACGPPPSNIHIRARSALRRVRAVDDDKYAAEKYMVAGQTITVLREAYEIPAGTGPIPQQRPLPDFTGGVGPADVPPVITPLPPPRIVPGTPIREARLATGLDADNQLLNVGQLFGADMGQLLVFVHVQDAPPNTIVGVSVRQGPDGIVGRRLLRVAGEKRLAVTFYPSRSQTFAPGDYECALTINGEDAGLIPFRVEQVAARIEEG